MFVFRSFVSSTNISSKTNLDLMVRIVSHIGYAYLMKF